MSTLNGTITFMPMRRPAKVDVVPFWSRKLSIPEGVTPCHILGIFQESSYEGTFVMAACELHDGRVFTQEVATIQFVDTDPKTGMLP